MPLCLTLRQILEDVIKFKWNALPSTERDGMKNYVSNLIISLSSDEHTFQRERPFINKLDTILIQILKHEWPNNWPSFVHDLVIAARNSETLCENCMYILRVRSTHSIPSSLTIEVSIAAQPYAVSHRSLACSSSARRSSTLAGVK